MSEKQHMFLMTVDGGLEIKMSFMLTFISVLFCLAKRDDTALLCAYCHDLLTLLFLEYSNHILVNIPLFRFICLFSIVVFGIRYQCHQQ